MTNYVAPPGRKFMYDRDGSVLFSVSEAGVVTEHDTTTKQRFNGETHGHGSVIGYGGTGTTYLGLIFPELRSIAGHYVNEELNWDGTASRGNIQTSDDTTTGVDGTWTQRQAAPFSVGQEWVANSGTGLTPKPTYRTNAQALVVASCKAIRWALVTSNSRNKFWVNLHVYGDLVAGQTPDRLRLWHPTLDQELTGAYFDLGDVQRAAVVDRPFRIKNNSATLTANNVLISVNALTDSSPTFVSQFTWSSPGAPSTFNTTADVGSIAPATISAAMTLRFTALSNATLSLWRQRVRAAATSWS